MGPDMESLGAGAAMIEGGGFGDTKEEIGDLVVCGKKARGLPRGFEPFHDPFSSSGRLLYSAG
jgi:hypothetical protein